MRHAIGGKKGLAVGLILSTLAAVALVFHAGDLEPWGPPGATMKPLSEIEPRRIIWGEMLSPAEPLRITQSGSYYLGEDIDASEMWGIEIAVSDVTIDLNGFALKNGFGSAIHLEPGNIWITRVTVRNGTISGWDSHGIDLTGFLTEYVVTDVVSSDNDGFGLYLSNGQVLDCAARHNGADGIVVGETGLVRDCIAVGNGNNGIQVGSGSIVSGCVTGSNQANGIRLSDHGLAMGNSSGANSQAGIRALARENRIEANHVTENDYGIYLDDGGFDSVVVRNSASSNVTQNYYVGTGNDVGPIGTATSSTSPWANIEN